MKESGSTVPCLHFRDKLLQLAQYAKSGRVDLDFVSWLRNSILEGKFSENERMFQDILGILDMRVAFELTAKEATTQLHRVLSGEDECALCPFPLDFLKSASCKTPFPSNLMEQDNSGGDATCRFSMSCSGQSQTQLDTAGFKRQKIVQLMDGQASSSVIQAPFLPPGLVVPKPYTCGNCGKRFQSSQGLGAHTNTCVRKSSARGHNLLSSYFRRSPDDADSLLCVTSQVPIEELTEAPTSSPTEAPADSPTALPITSSTKALAEALTHAHTKPTQALTIAPIKSTQTPTQAPTIAPTEELPVRAARSSVVKVRVARSNGFKLRVIRAYEVCCENSNIGAPATVVAEMFSIHVSMVSRWYKDKLKLSRKGKSRKTNNASKASAECGRNTFYKQCDKRLLEEFNAKRRVGARVGPKWFKMRMLQIVAEVDTQRLKTFKATGTWLQRWTERNRISVRRSTNRKPVDLMTRMPKIEQW